MNEVLDLSSQGLSFKHSAQLDIDQRIELDLGLEGSDPPIPIRGRVVWSHSTGRTGIRFRKMSRSSFRQLKQWMQEHTFTSNENVLSGMPSAAEEIFPRDTFEAQSLPDYAAILTSLGDLRRELDLAGTNLDPSLQQMTEAAHAFTGGTGAAIALASGNEMICRASDGASAPGIGTRVSLDAGFSAECIHTGQLLYCEDAENDPRVNQEACQALSIQSIMAVPIISAQGPIGLLSVFSSRTRAFDANSKIFLQRLARIACDAVETAAHAAGLAGIPADSVANAVNWPFGNTGWERPEPVTVSISASPRNLPLRLLRVSALMVAAALLFGALLLVPRIKAKMMPVRHADQQVPATPESPAATTASDNDAPQSDIARLTEAANQGDASAQFALAAHYATGEDVPQDYSIAVRWFTQAAEQGHVVAQATLGAYYWAGRGVPQDFRQAYFWSVLARAGGDEGSKYRLESLSSHMTRQQIVAAQDGADAWLQRHQITSQARNAAPEP